MSERGGIVTFFLFLFLLIIILLQILSMVQSDRFYRALNQLDEIFKGGARAAGERHEEYPGDEGDWLVWAFRVEPKTLNQFSADNDIGKGTEDRIQRTEDGRPKAVLGIPYGE